MQALITNGADVLLWVSIMTKRPLFSRMRDAVRAFRSDQSGNVVITFTLAMIPIIGFTGAAVDYSRGRLNGV